MWISGLAAATEVPVPTLKYYLREGLLMPGEATSRTRATYDQRHIERVRLIRALLESGGVGIAGARRVIEALETKPDPCEFLGTAHRTVPLPIEPIERSDEVMDLLAEEGWDIGEDCHELAGAITAALEHARGAGLEVSLDVVRRYLAAARMIGQVDIDVTMSATSPEEAMRTVVLGTVLIDPLILLLRRLAQKVIAVNATRALGAHPLTVSGVAPLPPQGEEPQ